MTATNRTLKDVETGLIFRLFVNSNTHEYKLIYEATGTPNEPAQGAEVNGFYICTFTNVDLKINNKKIISLKQGEFYNLKQGENITHKKFLGFDKFTKVK